MNFTHKNLVNAFQGVRVGKNSTMWKYCYIFNSKKEGGDYMEVYASDNCADFKNEMRFIIDNFPMPRKSFHTNIPFRSIEDFEEILKRMNVEVPERRERRECEKCKCIMPLSYFKNENKQCVTCH